MRKVNRIVPVVEQIVPRGSIREAFDNIIFMSPQTATEISKYQTRFNSTSFFIFVSACAFFAWTQYEFYQSALFSGDLIRNFSTYSGLMKLPWWIATFYGSELGGTIGGILRWIASFLVLYCSFAYWRNGESVLAKIRGKIGIALLLEVGYFLFLIPSVVLGFLFPFTAGKVWYFDVTPVPEVFYVAGVACLLMVLTVPTVLFKLRSQIIRNAPKADILKWACIALVAYLFVVFWFNSTMQWTGMIATWGIGILSDPWNFAGFASSVLAMFLIASCAVLTLLPTIKKQTASLKSAHLGAVATAFGGYFIFAILVYFAAGGFATHRSAWYELIVPHNPYAWCLIFFFAGIPIMIQSKRVR